MLFKKLGDTVRIIKSFSKFSGVAKDINEARGKCDFELEKSLIADATYEWAAGLIKDFNVTVNISGQENIPPREQACVFIANHQGYGDIVLIFFALKGHQVGFIAKDSLRNIPFLGKWITTIRGFFIKRGNARDALKMITEAGQYLKDGFSLAIFPEGTRSQGPKMGVFKPGSFKLATKNKVPVVPITIKGAYKLYEQQGEIKGDTVSIVIHKPIETVGLARKEAIELPARVEKIIKDELEKSID